ncbi:MAG: CBS domain-containing protein [Spirochaetales bacterium]|nr:CBS domain-containing protein [Spirochaetales bacterium]
MELVQDILAKKGNQIWSVTPETEIKTALNLMQVHNVGALLVLDKNNRIAGIVSERDYTRASATQKKLSMETPVQEIMTSEVICIDPMKEIDDCMALMTNKRIRHLPVIKNGQLLGVISIGDLVMALITEKNILIDQLEHYIEGSL